MKGKVAIVTGGTKGIGFATAELLVQKGCKVVITGRNQKTVDGTALKLGRNVLGIRCDMADCEEINRMVEATRKKYKRIDILVNNAGISGDIGDTDKIIMEDARNVIDANVNGLIWLTRLVVKEMKKQKSGSIVNVSSCVALRGFSGFTVYSATKGAVRSLSLALAKELAPLNIRVNMVSPGIIRTYFHDHMGGGKHKDGIKFQNAALGLVPMNRTGKPEEVASVIAFLADDNQSGYVTGADIPVDGGVVV